MEREAIAVQSVKDLQASGKRWLEDVLGRHLEENQRVFIMVFTPGVIPSDAARREALAGLEATWADVEKHRKEHGIDDKDFDSAVDEAMRHLRPNNS
jgi:hypothetical protein